MFLGINPVATNVDIGGTGTLKGTLWKINIFASSSTRCCKFGGSTRNGISSPEQMASVNRCNVCTCARRTENFPFLVTVLTWKGLWTKHWSWKPRMTEKLWYLWWIFQINYSLRKIYDRLELKYISIVWKDNSLCLSTLFKIAITVKWPTKTTHSKTLSHYPL